MDNSAVYAARKNEKIAVRYFSLLKLPVVSGSSVLYFVNLPVHTDYGTLQTRLSYFKSVVLQLCTGSSGTRADKEGGGAGVLPPHHPPYCFIFW